MTPVDKILAVLKGEIIGHIITEKEYYYLMFGCENNTDIEVIKSITVDEIAKFNLYDPRKTLARIKVLRALADVDVKKSVPVAEMVSVEPVIKPDIKSKVEPVVISVVSDQTKIDPVIVPVEKVTDVKTSAVTLPDE